MGISQAELAAFGAQLSRELAALDDADRRGQDGRGIVELDQQAIGRLSRMDAIQHRAMADAGHRQRQAARLRIVAALARIDTGEYGWCSACGQPIAIGRLRIDPAAPCCVGCTAG